MLAPRCCKENFEWSPRLMIPGRVANTLARSIAPTPRGTLALSLATVDTSNCTASLCEVSFLRRRGLRVEEDEVVISLRCGDGTGGVAGITPSFCDERFGCVSCTTRRQESTTALGGLLRLIISGSPVCGKKIYVHNNYSHETYATANGWCICMVARTTIHEWLV